MGESRQSVTCSEDKPPEGQWEGLELLSRGAGLEVGSSCYPWGCPWQTPAHSPHTTGPNRTGRFQSLHGYCPAGAITTRLIPRAGLPSRPHLEHSSPKWGWEKLQAS